MRLLVAGIALFFLLGGVVGSDRAESYQKATIVAVQPRESSSRVHKTTDAPPPTSEADYDITVKIGDKDYVGRYRHASDYIPGNWKVGETVEGRVGKHKHRIYLKDLSGKEVAMPIVLREPANASGK